ncbi:hypothetical protein [Microseira wollei]|uniref:Uncharacterized protein n=1 Tax=Microseira wollei NIES-4236 TaxID=2530354 RepID=A0AAV3X4U6_9CYAN|nr:hypothetical protein [Microseira wollei]GET35610.1 hypothetical protein MiSe_03520 [Microseira wollei NIES-4236]
MVLTELLPILKELSREDKQRVIDFLSSEIAEEETLKQLKNGGNYEVWSPYDAFEAAQVLEKMLEEHQKTQNPNNA